MENVASVCTVNGFEKSNLMLEIEIDNNLERYLLELHFINHCI